jgi:hypothetical protein
MQKNKELFIYIKTIQKWVIHTTKMSYSYIIHIQKNELFIYTKKGFIHTKKLFMKKKEVIHTKNELFIQQKWIIHILYIQKMSYSYIYIKKI